MLSIAYQFTIKFGDLVISQFSCDNQTHIIKHTMSDLDDDIFAGRTNSKYGKICKNINFVNFYNTKKLYTNDSEYTFGLMRVMFEDFKLRNSLVGPAFFDHICKYNGDASQFWLDFMIGANRASIFNPATYNGILNSVFSGKTLFAPVMGWNAYQLGFYGSNFTNLEFS